MVEHPVIPAGTSNGKARNRGKAAAWEYEIIATTGWVQATTRLHIREQRRVPFRIEIQCFPHVQVPALTDEQEFIQLVQNLFCMMDEFRRE